MEKLKPFDEITFPDERQSMFASFDDETHEFKEMTLEEHYEKVACIALNCNVPEDVKSHFETTKNLLLYSWYVYRFISVAEFHAAASLEFALKKKAQSEVNGLFNLIDHAISQGWVKDEGFSTWMNLQDIDEEFEFEDHQRKSYISTVKKTIPKIRNNYAHGSNSISPGGYAKLSQCAEFINQLYPG